MKAADLLVLWLEERGYGKHDIWRVNGKLYWIRPPRGSGFFMWFKEDNTHLVVSQKNGHLCGYEREDVQHR